MELSTPLTVVVTSAWVSLINMVTVRGMGLERFFYIVLLNEGLLQKGSQLRGDPSGEFPCQSL